MKLYSFYCVRAFANKEIADFCLKEFKTIKDAEKWLLNKCKIGKYDNCHFTIEKIYVTL